VHIVGGGFAAAALAPAVCDRSRQEATSLEFPARGCSGVFFRLGIPQRGGLVKEKLEKSMTTTITLPVA